jgi:trans-2-enoyl-CoA reductase
MKIKLTFITNSSSVSYLISSEKTITKRKLINEGMPSRFIERLNSITTLDDLIEYVAQEPCDWTSRVCGPRRFWGETEEFYKSARKTIEKGKIATFINIERNNWDKVELFERIIQEVNCQIVERESR